jgi:hypothetical protein
MGVDTSTVSQADADAKAAARIATEGQTYANIHASCMFYSAPFDSMVRKNDCPAGGTGSLVHIQYAAGAFGSSSSQQHANEAAMAQAQVDANGLGTCTFESAAVDQDFVKNDCANGATGTSVHFQLAAGEYSSTISQADADAQAQAAGQAYANANGKCPLNASITWWCTDNNCDYQGQPVIKFDFPAPTTSVIKVQLGILFYYTAFPKYVHLGSSLFTPPAGSEPFFAYAGPYDALNVPLEITIPVGVTTFTTSGPIYQHGYTDQPHSWFWCQSCQAQVREFHMKITSGSYIPAFVITNSGVSLYNVE